MYEREFQRTRFRNWCKNIPEVDIPIDEVENFVKLFASNYGYYINIFKQKRKTMIWHNGILFDLREQTIPLHTVCRLIARYLSDKLAPVESLHGKTFCKIFAEVLATLTTTPVQDVISSMHSAKLKVADEASPVGARTLKRHEKMKNRVIELDAAVTRGREEFEQFLQPILKELEDARLELETLETKMRK